MNFNTFRKRYCYCCCCCCSPPPIAKQKDAKQKDFLFGQFLETQNHYTTIFWSPVIVVVPLLFHKFEIEKSKNIRFYKVFLTFVISPFFKKSIKPDEFPIFCFIEIQRHQKISGFVMFFEITLFFDFTK